MSRVGIFTYLNNADLHCISAYEILHRVMSYSRLSYLKRFKYWTFDFDEASYTKTQQVLDSLLNDSYMIVNPNKESYFLNRLPVNNVSSDEKRFLIQVTNKETNITDELLQRLSEKIPIKLLDLQMSLVWEIGVTSLGQSTEIIQQDLSERVILSSKREGGLLVHPLFEEYCFLDGAQFYDRS